MINTHGLSHINLEVSDPDASMQFYKTLFGVKEYYRDENSIQVLGPGANDSASGPNPYRLTLLQMQGLEIGRSHWQVMPRFAAIPEAHLVLLFWSHRNPKWVKDKAPELLAALKYEFSKVNT